MFFAMYASGFRFTVLCCAACSVFAGADLYAADKPKLPEGAGKETTQRVCGACHGAEIVMSRRETQEGWSGIVEDMIQRGMKGTDEEYNEVVDYLTANFPKSAPLPKVNINKAAAEDITAGLGLQYAHASAIVRYREANGNFKDFEDLRKVPGLRISAIEAKKNRLEY